VRKTIFLSTIACLLCYETAFAQCNWTPGSGVISITCGNVGIGNPSPTYQLHQTPTGSGVAHQIDVPIVTSASETIRLAGASGGGWFGGALTGGFNSAGQGFVQLQSLHGANANTIVYGDPSGNVGIGTSAPASFLEVKAPASATELARFSGSNANGGYTVFFDGSPNANTIRGFVGYGPTLFTGLAMSDVGIRSQGGLAFAAGGGYTRAYIDATGNIGIGTSAPSATLDVLRSYADGATLLNVNGGASASGYRLVLQDNGVSRFRTQKSGATILDVVDNFTPGLTVNQTGANYAAIFTGGNVGIGVPNPAYRLDVNGTGRYSGLLALTNPGPGATVLGNAGAPNYVAFDDTANPGGKKWRLGESGASAFGQFDIYNETDNRLGLTVVGTSGNVGIGTAGPATPIHIYKKDVTTNTVTSMLTLEHDATSQPAAGGFGSAIDFVNRNNSGSGETKIASVQAYFAVPGNANSGILDFRTSNAGADPTSRMVIDNLGNVGIGSPNPSYKLDVNGTIRATSVIGAVYQDVAEWVPSAEQLEAGTVVVLRPGHSNEVTASREAYDTKVAGVVSAQPGVLLGQAGDGKSMIATTGRVRVRVDATKHPIAVGDLLVTSDEVGAAMYSQPIEIAGVTIHRPGTIIGKALEPLESGTGEILVLLSLQ